MTQKKTTDQEYDEVLARCRDIFEKKLYDYGTSWRVMRPSSLTDQIYIKARRIRSFEEKGCLLVDEGIESEYIGIVNYCVIALIVMKISADKKSVEKLDVKEAMSMYDDVTERISTLFKAKNHDYDEAWRHMRCSSFTDIILQKLLRTREIENNNGNTLISEGTDANYMDMVNYAIFALIKIDEARDE